MSKLKKDEYLKLVEAFPLKHITSDTMLKKATKVLHGLIDREKLSKAATDYVEVLTDLIERYEDEHHEIPVAKDSQVLKMLMEAQGIRAAQVARETKISESTISDVLKDKRTLTRSQIGVIASYFHVEVGAFAFPAQVMTA